MLRILAVLVSAALVTLLAFTFASTRGSLAYLYMRLAPLQGPDAGEGAGDRTADAAAQLRRAPLSAQAYYVLGLSRERAGDPGQAQALIERSAAMNPRFLQARLWLALNHLRSGRVELGIGEVAWLLARKRSLAPQLMVVLVEASREPRARKAVAERLANTPTILSLAHLGAQAGFGAPALRELVAATDLAALPDGAAVQSLIAKQLIEEGRFREARNVWFELGGARPAAEVFDGGFEGLKGGAPFGWTLTNDQDVKAVVRKRAGPGGSGALAVQTFSSLRSTVAEQSLVLAPGAYRLRFQALVPNRSGDRESPYFWALKCPDGKLLLEAFIEPSASWTERTHRFEVPGHCPMQSLTLNRDSTTDSRARQLMVSAVEVIR